LRAAASDLPASVERLGRLVSDNPDETRRLAPLRTETEKLMVWLHEIQDLAKQSRWEDVTKLMATRRGLLAVGEVRRIEGEMREVEESLDRQRIEKLKQLTARQNSVLLVSFALSVTIGGIALAFFGKNIGRRFAVLEKNVQRVARGERLETLLGGTDELAELDRSFHRMAEALAAARDQEHNSQETLERRNQDLVVVNRELDQKNRENEMFVYSVSHDLRSPLVNLQGFSKELGMVRDDLRGLVAGPMGDAERARAKTLIDRDISESIHFIQTAVSRLATIIDALLKLSRAGRVEYRAEVVELNPIVEKIVVAMRDTIAEHHAEISVQPLPPAWGDRAALEQIFANLIGNAVNYLSRERPGRIEVGVSDRLAPGLEQATVFFVRDNGLGIPEAYLPKLFIIFQRLHGAIAPGEGIGLALVRRAVERHGGRIWAESAEGVGSTFFFALPPQNSSTLEVAATDDSRSVRASSIPFA
jgi:signal transduction histidine kinase